MNAFSKVIGYNKIKERLLQVCDMIKNPEIYEAAGAKFPGGIMLYGNPGMGKSLMARCFIEECGVPSYTICRTVGDGDFLKKIADTFEEAKQTAPSVIHLEDLDKFANEDEMHKDAEEYVAVQSAIDSVRGHRVIVIATVNDRRKLPDSLVRAGRFDITLKVMIPNRKEADLIMKYYLSNKNISPDVNLDDVAHMIRYSSCAELESVLNTAAIHAAADRRKELSTGDLVKAVFGIMDEFSEEQEDADDSDDRDQLIGRKQTACHEAGHMVVSEIMQKGSVGYARVYKDPHEEYAGEAYYYLPVKQKEDRLLVLLAGKAATEMYFSGEYASGCASDQHKAADLLAEMIEDDGLYGTSLLDPQPHLGIYSDYYMSKVETSIHLEIERLLMKAKKLLAEHRAFLEKATEDLFEKGLLLASDIRRIYEETENARRTG